MKKKIALFVGSFSPFHIGHLNIVEKSEDIFGKGNVIVCFGINPKKVAPEKLDQYISNVEVKASELRAKIDRPVEIYTGFLHDFINELEEKGNDVVVVRGLRNGDDLDYEINQLRFINDFKKDVKTIFIACDREYEHISSTAINKLEEFGGKEIVKRYLV